jgi:ribulose-5-phosphate 4-epimerase/fuculose-1-phosphate aldolase
VTASGGPVAALVEAGRWLAARGLAPGSSGNVSIRDGTTWLVTPTGRPLGRLAGEDLARLDGSASHIEGPAPSKEHPLHFAVYQARPTASAIVHLHSTYAVALSCLADVDPERPLRPLTPYQVMRLDRLVVVPYAMPGSPELAEAVQTRAKESPVLLLANHGSLVAAPTLDEAVAVAEELEEAARVALLVAGRPTRPLDAGQVAEIRARFSR